MRRYSLITKYAALNLHPDPRQQQILSHLTELLKEVNTPRSWLSRILPFNNSPRGVYLYGSVGSGKTMLMDMFYQEVTVNKTRLHFNQFMMEVHARMRKERSLKQVAKQLGDNQLLCLDELQVTDIADAMILRGLFEGILDAGCYIMLTSNRAPRDLYINGIQRASFLPCIALLEQRLEVLSLQSERDYRQASNQKGNYAFASSAELVDLYHQLVLRPQPKLLQYAGREWSIRHAGDGVAMLSFADLCCEPRSASDYLELTRHFKTILISDVPAMHSMRQREEARRFMTLIDILYDAQCKVALNTIGVSLDQLFNLQEMEGVDRVMMDELACNAASSLFTGAEEVFAANRTISRLVQMTTSTWWQQ